MRRQLVVAAVASGMIPVLAACGDDDPLGLGRELAPGGAVTTYELVLDAADFIEEAVLLGGFGRPAGVPFMMVASEGAAGVDSRALLRPPAFPEALQVPDAAGNLVVDSTIRYVGGTLVVRVDTLGRPDEGAVVLRLFRTQESWDPATATWELAVDSAARQVEWSTPGGGPLEPLDSAVLAVADDSIAFAVDSLTAALWADTTREDRGGVIVLETAGARLRLVAPVLRLQARPSLRPDTLLTVTVAPSATTFIYTPAPGPAEGLRVGGIPGWRTYIRMSSALDTLTVPCPGAAAGCRVPLDRATISYASLLLTPVPAAAGFRPESPVALDARPVLAAPGIPLVRSPLGALVGRVIVEPSQLPGGEDGLERLELPITPFIANYFDAANDGTQVTTLAIASAVEPGTFGYVAFAEGGGAGAEPRLRLIVTAGSDLVIR